MPANDLLHNDLREAYARLLDRRRNWRMASTGVLAAAAAVCAAVIGIAALNGPDAAAEASGPGSDAYIKCLNEHGWAVGPGLSIDPDGNAPAPGVIDGAVAACQDLENGILDVLQPSDEAFQRLSDQSNRFAACMRGHGVDVGAPDLFRNRVGIGVIFPGLDPRASGSSDAYEACKSIMSSSR
jgi:hypothetical protein